jgi:hypothetical protein
MKLLWILYVAGQIFSTGNMNYQQKIGMYEINPAYPKHPSKERIIYTKSFSTLCVYGATKKWPKYKKSILVGANVQVYGFIISDKLNGISMSVSF